MTESNRPPQGGAEAAALQFSEQIPHSRALGMQVVSINGGQVCMRLSPKCWMFAEDNVEEVCTSVLYSLADSACGLAVFLEARDMSPIATVDLRMDYLRSASGDRDLLAKAVCRQLTDEVAFIHCDILCEGNGELLATTTATFMRNTKGQQFNAADR